jgi:hypothetical protein
MARAKKTGAGGSSASSGGGGGADNGESNRSLEQLEYMSDLILQLKRMAESSGFSDLAGALERAHSVARDRLGRRHGE